MSDNRLLVHQETVDAREHRLGMSMIVLLPFEAGRKTRRLALVRHRGGGWYEVSCMGSGKRCKAGECNHTANMVWGKPGGRPVRQVPR